MITLTINNKNYTVNAEKTLLEIIREHDIDYIPTLCHNEQLEPYAACFLCVVEITGQPALKPACSTYPVDNMVVITNSPRVIESRKANLELLLSNHRADCYPPCKLACPANVDIQGYIALCARGLYYEGQKLMRETNALPLVCGKVCARPCEDACRRNYVDEPVDIKNIKRFMAERDLSAEKYLPKAEPLSGCRVAVIGSGPAGLSAAYFLRLKGHQVTIFEKLPEAGGMMRYGIPEYRLPKAGLQKEIDLILSLGIEIEFNKELGRDFSIDSLLAEGFNSVFLGIGAQLGSSMGIPGENLSGIMQGVHFLREINLGNELKLHGRVYIIGGGNTAIDAARTALRSGADTVTIVYRRTEAEMPADKEEIHDAKDEGIELKVLHNPVKYEGSNGQLKGIKLIKMELGEPDSSGRRRPVAIDGSEYVEPVDFVIEAIGQKVDTSAIGDIGLSKWGTIEADDALFLTDREGVFAGGDAVMGPDIIIGAVAHGRKAAFVIDRYVKGEELCPEDRLGFYIRKEDFGVLNADEFSKKEKIKRLHIQKESAAERVKSFIEVEKGFTEEDVLKEAARCMECGCQDIFECKLKQYCTEYNAGCGVYTDGEYRDRDYDSGHRYISIETNKCINCGQCVRVCSEVQKQSVFSLDKRGFESTPIPYGYKALDDTNCIACGMCAALCPVGAISEKLPLGKPGPFDNRKTVSYCTLCGDGCSIVVETRDNRFMKISSKTDNDTFYDNLCEKGRFGYEQFCGLAASVPQTDGQAIKDRVAQLAGKKTLIAISPECTLEEIDLVAEYAEKHNADLFSFSLYNDYNKIQLLQKYDILPGKAEAAIAEYDEIAYFGEFCEEYNSVSFRKLVRNDKEQVIHIASDISHAYIKHNEHSDGSSLLEYCKVTQKEKKILFVFNFQHIEYSLFEKIIHYLYETGSEDYIIMNNYINYSYLLNKIKNGAEIQNRLGEYDALIVLNEDKDLIQQQFSDILIFSDKNDLRGNFIPLKSLYQKSGTIIDQWGNKKNLVRSCDGFGYMLSDFFKG